MSTDRVLIPHLRGNLSGTAVPCGTHSGAPRDIAGGPGVAPSSPPLQACLSVSLSLFSPGRGKALPAHRGPLSRCRHLR